MADINHTVQRRRNRDLCYALKRKEDRDVIQVCRDLPEGPLQRIGTNNDTVLHMTVHSKQSDLVLELLKMLPENRNHRLVDIKNRVGNTILHEVATSDNMIGVGEKLLNRDEELLIAHNDLGEMPIFCAARYGQTLMFKFLAEKMDLKERSSEDGKRYLQRNDGTTVLHISIGTECFELAHFIAESYPYLIEERDQDSMTALQYVACNPTIFGRQKVKTRRWFIEELINSYWSPKNKSVTRDERYSSLQQLVMLLVENDTSLELEATMRVPYCNGAQNLVETQTSQESSTREDKKSDETPLFLATKSNNLDVVKAIVAFHPHALEHTNKKGRNILHEAIRCQQTDIFDLVLEYEMFAKRLLTATDNEGNSLLHMVGKKRKSQASEKMQSPALQLRNEMRLFEKVKSATRMHFIQPLNRMNQTAEELFAATNDQLHREAKEWLMRTSENCIIVSVSVFIGAVALAAAYIVSGGPVQSTGIPILNRQSFFVLFILADWISLTLALTSMGIFLSILTSSFPLQDIQAYLFKKLIQGIICLILSVSMMAVAFGATIIQTMAHNWENVLWHVVAFLPVPFFFLSYSPLRSAFLGTCRELFKKVVFPVLAIFLVVPIFLLWEAGRGLLRIVAEGCAFIGKSVPWIPRIKSLPTSDTRSPQPPADRHNEV